MNRLSDRLLRRLCGVSVLTVGRGLPFGMVRARSGADACETSARCERGRATAAAETRGSRGDNTDKRRGASYARSSAAKTPLKTYNRSDGKPLSSY